MTTPKQKSNPKAAGDATPTSRLRQVCYNTSSEVRFPTFSVFYLIYLFDVLLGSKITFRLCFFFSVQGATEEKGLHREGGSTSFCERGPEAYPPEKSQQYFDPVR